MPQAVKEFLKVVHTWRRYGYEYGSTFLTSGVLSTLCFKKKFTLFVFTITKSDVDQF